MPNPNKKALYDKLVQDGKYSRSFEDFQFQFQQPESQQALFNALQQDGLYNRSFEDFGSQFFSDDIQKKKYEDAFSEAAITADEGQDASSSSQQGGFDDFMPFNSGQPAAPATPQSIANDTEFNLGSSFTSGFYEWFGGGLKGLANVTDAITFNEKTLQEIKAIKDPEKRREMERIMRESNPLGMASEGLDIVGEYFSNLSAGAKSAAHDNDLRSMSEAFSDGDYATAFKKASNSAAESMGLMVGAAMSVGGGFAGGTSAVAAATEQGAAKTAAAILTTSNPVATAMGIQTGLTTYEENLDAGMGHSWQNVANSAVKGVAETYFEKVTLGIANNALGKLAGNAAGAKRAASDIAFDIMESIGKEATSEELTSLVQTAADDIFKDIYTGKEVKFGDYVEAMFEGGVTGAIMGGGMHAGGDVASKMTDPMKVYMAQRSMNTAEKEQLVGLVNRQAMLTGYLQVEKEKGDDASQAKIKEYEDSLAKVNNDIKELSSVGVDRLREMTEKDISQMVGASRGARAAQRAFDQLEEEAEKGWYTEEEVTAKKKQLVAEMDDHMQNESQVIAEIQRRVEERKTTEKILGINLLPNKGKPVEMIDAEEFAQALRLRADVEAALSENIDTGADELQIQAIEKEKGEADIVSQAELDEMVDEETTYTNVEEGETAETAAIRAAGEAGFSPNGEIELVIEEETGAKMVKVGTPNGIKTFKVRTDEAGEDVSVTNVEPTETVGMVKIGIPKGQKSLRPSSVGKPTTDGALVLDEKGQVTSIDESWGSVKKVKNAIDGHNKIGGRLGIYGAKMVDGKLHLEMADKQAKIVFDLVVDKDGTISFPYQTGGGAGLRYVTGFFSDPDSAFPALMTDIGELSEIDPLILETTGWQSRYTEKFGETSKPIKGAVNDNRITQAQKQKIKDKRGVDFESDFLTRIGKLVKSGTTGSSFDLSGKKITPKAGTITATINSIIIGNTKEGGVYMDEVGMFVTQTFLDDTLEGTTHQNTIYGFWIMDNGDIVLDFNIVLDESHSKTAIAFAKWNNQEALYLKRKDGTEDFPETGNNTETTSKGAKVLETSHVKNAQAVLNSGVVLTNPDSFDKAILDSKIDSFTFGKDRSERTRNILKAFTTMFPGAKSEYYEKWSDAVRVHRRLHPGQNGQIQSQGFELKIGKEKSVILYPDLIIIIGDRSNENMGEDSVTAHEVWHSILGAAFAKNPKLLKVFKKAIETELTNSGLNDFNRYLNAFSGQPHYKKSGDTYEEYIVEFAGLMYRGMSGTNEAPNPSAAQMFSIIQRAIANAGSYFIGEEVLNPAEVTEKNILSWIATVNKVMVEGGDVSVINQYDKNGEIPFSNPVSINTSNSVNGELTMTSDNVTFNQYDPEYEVGFEESFSKGEIDAVPFMADRMATGTYRGINPESGIEIKMQGGIGCPNMKEWFGKIGWFVEGGAVASSLKGGLMRLFDQGKPVYGMPMFMSPNAHMSNQTFAMCFMAECNYLIQNGQKTEQEIIDAINTAIEKHTLGKKDLSTKWGIDPKTGKIKDKNSNKALRVWAKDTTPKNSVFTNVSGQNMSVAFSSFEPRKVESLDEWFDIMRTTFDARKGFFAGLYGGDNVVNPGKNARALGLPDVAKIVELTTDPRSKGLPNGTAVSVIEFLPKKMEDGTHEIIFAPEDLDVDPHMSYALAMRGVSRGYLKQPIHVKELGYTDPEQQAKANYNWKSGQLSEAEATARSTRSITMKVPTAIVNSHEVTYDSMTEQERVDKLNSKIGELLLTGRLSFKGSQAITDFFTKIRGSAAVNQNTREAVAALLADLLGNITTDTKVDFTQEDIGAIMNRAARMNPNGPVSIASFEKFLMSRVDKASKRTAREAAQLAREQAKEEKAKTKMIEEIVKTLKLNAKRGKISLAQLNTILKRFNRVNWGNTESIAKFFEYATNVASNAEYANQIAEARILQAKMKKAKRSKNIQASTRDIASAFSKLDPRKVTDIDEYLMHAKMIEEALRTNRFVGFTEDGEALVTIKDVLPHGPVNEFIEQETAEQDEMRRQEFMAKYGELMADGVIDETMTLEEMQAIVTELEGELKQELNENKKAAVDKYLTKMLEYQKNRLDEAVTTGIDPETGQVFSMTPEQEKLFKKLFSTTGAVANMNEKEKYKMLESIDNFFENGVTDGIRALIASATGRAMGNAFSMKAAALGFSLAPGGIGKALSSRFQMGASSLPIAGSRFFNGIKEWNKVMSQMGLNKFVEGSIAAQIEAKAILDEYIKTFESKGFMTSDRIVNRGVIATLLRNVMSGTTNQDIEFKRRVRIAKESAMSSLKDRDPNVREQAKIAIQKINNLTEGVNNYKEFLSKIESLSENEEFKKDVDAVKFWQDKWADTYDKADAISREVYDVILEKDVSYTPDRMVRVRTSTEEVDIDEGFFSGEYVPTQSAGTLKKATRPNKLNGRALSFNFDTNMHTAMETALVDINTAEATRYVKEFLNSEGWANSFADDADKRVMTDKIIKYMKRARNVADHKGGYVVSDNMLKAVNKFTKLMQSVILTSLAQPLKQALPVMANTFINSDGRLPGIIPGGAADMWLRRQPYAINVRGIDSRSDVVSITDALAKESSNIFGKGLQAVEKLIDLKLKAIVEAPDVAVARASWINYYLDFIGKQEGGGRLKTNTFNIDWESHEVNKEAAEYAQAMVDRQQNVSDTRMSGEWFQGANELSAARKFVMPFATFIMNQKQRVSADVNIMTSKTATIEEKARAANSIAGAMIEIGVFTMVKAANLSVMVYLASKLAGDDDDEAKARAKEKWDESFGPKLFGQMAVELLPAPPVFDDAMNQFVINPLANAMGYEGKLNYVDENKSSIEVLLGGFMTSVDRAVKPIDMFEEAKSGKFEMKNRYTGEMETKYYLPKDKEMMKTVAELAWSSWLLTEDGIRIAERAMKDARYRAMSEKEYLKYMAESSGDYEEYDAYRRQKKEESREGRSERKEAKAKKEAKRQERM